MFLYCIREREMILDLFEALTGRAAALRLPPGGRHALRHPGGLGRRCRETVDHIEGRLDEYEAMLEGNAFFLVRTQGVGVISRELAQEVGVSGPLIRGSGVAYDVRRAEPYSSVRGLRLQGAGGDGGRLLRALPRADAGVPRVDPDRPPGARRAPRGPISSRPGVKSVGQVRVPKGEGYARVEGARGEVGLLPGRRRVARSPTA